MSVLSTSIKFWSMTKIFFIFGKEAQIFMGHPLCGEYSLIYSAIKGCVSRNFSLRPCNVHFYPRWYVQRGSKSLIKMYHCPAALHKYYKFSNRPRPRRPAEFQA
jgi:hypothetical protein